MTATRKPDARSTADAGRFARSERPRDASPGFQNSRTGSLPGSRDAPRPVRYSCVVIGREGGARSAALRGLPAFGFRPFVAPSTQVAFDILRQWRFDAALVDGDGFGAGHVDILRELRSRLEAPVILLTRPQAEREQIRSLESGATEVVVKPASARLLAVKMQRLIECSHRGPEARDDGRLLLGPLAMNPRLGLATIDDRPLRLTAHQFDLLHLLASRVGEYVDRETIAMRLRGCAESVGRSTDVQVSRIRRRLRDEGVDALHVDTVHGRGYLLTLEPEARRTPGSRGAPAALQ